MTITKKKVVNDLIIAKLNYNGIMFELIACIIILCFVNVRDCNSYVLCLCSALSPPPWNAQCCNAVYVHVQLTKLLFED